MRGVGVVVLLLLGACASEKLALTPPPGRDFSGSWQLNEADSDDPLHLVQSQHEGPAPGTSGSPDGQGGRGGRGGGRGSRGGDGYGAGGPGAPSMPAVDALSEGLRWPGKQLTIKQVAGVIAITSAGVSQVYQPVSDTKAHPHRSRDRGDAPPPFCGWDDKTLVVQSRDPDDDHPPFEKRYSVSDDGQRLIEVVSFRGGRSRGFTISRVWDREGAPDAPTAQ